MINRLLKALHEVGAVGVMGSLATVLLLSSTAPTDSLAGYAAVRRGIALISQWLLVPSLGLTLVSGLLAIAATPAYQNAAWAWVKALFGIGMFEGILVTVGGSARRAADLSALAATGQGDPALLAQVLRTERGALWLMLSLSLLNIILAVWRPRLFPRSVGG